MEVIQTHISVVFLAGNFAYKLKKPVDLGFLDFTTLERRERFCREEVRLNRRLAADVYLGVVPVVAGEEGPRLALDDPDVGEPLEWAVRMRRLPEELTMAAWIEEGALRAYHVAVLGRRLAEFHREAAAGPEISRWGRFEVVAGNARENLEQARPHVGLEVGGLRGALTDELLARLSDALERELDRLEPLIEERAGEGIPRDTHGDLHLEHVYVFPDRDPPEDIVIVDCIEFNERFRFADPVSDIAFLDMDLRYHGRPDLSRVLAGAYFDASGDAEGRSLLPFYSAYRAAVRAKVAGMRAADAALEDPARARALEEARGHWLLALGLLEPPGRRPCLVLIGGLPGTGKSTLARTLSLQAELETLSSDLTRKRLAGLDPDASASAAFGEGIYTDAWNDRTYEALLREAADRLLEGARVVVDASFREDARRADFLALARRLRVPAVFLQLVAPPARVVERIREREAGPSDADETIYLEAAERWEPASDRTGPSTRLVDTGQSPVWSVEQSLGHLRELGVTG